MGYETFLYDVSEGIAVLTFNRPDRRNAFNERMAIETQEALRQAERDAGVRALVVTGAGAGFCAGQDLDEVQQSGDGRSFREHLLRTYNPIVLKLRTLEKPVIAAV